MSLLNEETEDKPPKLCDDLEPSSRHLPICYCKCDRRKLLQVIIIAVAFFTSISISTIVVPIVPNLIYDNETEQNKTTSPTNVTLDYKGLKMGIFFGSYGFMQIFGSPLIGLLVDRTSCLLSVMIGIILDASSVIMYSLGTSYPTLIIARILNSLAWSAISCGSYASISNSFNDEKTRAKLIGIANVFICLGQSLGPVYGGTMHEFVGFSKTFLVVLPIIVINGILTMALWLSRFSCEKVLGSMVERTNEAYLQVGYNNNINDNEGTLSKLKKAPTPIYRLVADPHVFVLTAAVYMVNVGMSAVECSLSLHLRNSFGASEYQQGIVWTPTIAFSFMGTALGFILCAKFHSHRHIFLMISLIIGGVSYICMPYLNKWFLVIFPLGTQFLIMTICEYIIMPLAMTIIDLKFVSVYGSISAILGTAISLADISGSLLGSLLYERLGFSILCIGFGCSMIFYSPVMIILRKFNRHYYEKSSQTVVEP